VAPTNTTTKQPNNLTPTNNRPTNNNPPTTTDLHLYYLLLLLPYYLLPAPALPTYRYICIRETADTTRHTRSPSAPCFHLETRDTTPRDAPERS
jgi:hypothetical protein